MLFGHQNDDTNQPAQDVSAASDLATPPAPQADSVAAPGINPLAVDPATGASLPAVANEAEEADDTVSAPTVEPAEQPVAEVAPEISTPSFDAPTEPEPAQAPAVPEPSFASEPAPAAAGSDELLELKQQALSQLSPLVGQLEQSPEEKFRTTMMLIQSTDNQSLLKEAYDAAQAIPDEKTRAQALLDVVNEINYFTQQKAN